MPLLEALYPLIGEARMIKGSCCCGLALGEILSTEESFPIAANSIDDAIEIENKFHEFISAKPSWLKIGDSAKQFDGHPS